MFPDQILREYCAPVENFDSENLCAIFAKMLEIMYAHKGAGIAAPQLGIKLRLVAVNAGTGELKLVNPFVVEKNSIELVKEGCLSIPDTFVNIPRAQKILVRGMNENCEPLSLECNGLLAQVIQHEIDHLDGKLIIDYMTKEEYVEFSLNHVI